MPATVRDAIAAWAACAWLAAMGLLSTPAQAQDADPRVRVTTNMGAFVIELNPRRAPLTVENFLRYVREGYYSGTLFHRVVAQFVVQGGGHAASDFKLKPTQPPVVNESGNGLPNVRGAVGLARSEGPHTGNAQFYINLVDNPDLNPLASRWGYAVFGKVVEGMNVVDRIGVVPTGSMGPFTSEAPLQAIVIEKVELLDAAGMPVQTSGSPTSPARETAGESAAAPATDTDATAADTTAADADIAAADADAPAADADTAAADASTAAADEGATAVEADAAARGAEAAAPPP